jgi:hypothetical protein
MPAAVTIAGSCQECSGESSGPASGFCRAYAVRFELFVGDQEGPSEVTSYKTSILGVVAAALIGCVGGAP